MTRIKVAILFLSYFVFILAMAHSLWFVEYAACFCGLISLSLFADAASRKQDQRMAECEDLALSETAQLIVKQMPPQTHLHLQPRKLRLVEQETAEQPDSTVQPISHHASGPDEPRGGLHATPGPPRPKTRLPATEP